MKKLAIRLGTWGAALGIVTLFATAGLNLGLALTCRQLRRIG